MSRRLWVSAAAAASLLVLLWLGGRHWGWPAHSATSVRVEPVTGGDGGGLPRATPLDERMDAAALERVAQEPAAAGLEALAILRDGHIVFDRYGHGLSASTAVDGGSFARAVLGLVAGIAANDGLTPAAVQAFDPAALREAIETGAHQPYADYLSHKLWSRLNASSAEFRYPAARDDVADCCLYARVPDWMRVASLLTDNGRFEGKQVVPAGWVQRMQRPLSLDSMSGFGIELAGAAHGAEPFATAGVFFVRGPAHWRLWLVPPLKLAILFGAEAVAGNTAASWDETRLPNLVIRAVSDRPPEPGDLSELQRLVPGH